MSPLLARAAHMIQLMCGVCKISLPVSFEENYVSFPLNELGVKADFFIRGATVGIAIKNADSQLFYLLQDLIANRDLMFHVHDHGVPIHFVPIVSGNGQYMVDTPSPHPLCNISSGNVREITHDLPTGRTDACIEDRAAFLSSLLFTQWIVPMMPHIQTFARYKKLGLLQPMPPVQVQREVHNG